jgi:hypothetical protein
VAIIHLYNGIPRLEYYQSDLTALNKVYGTGFLAKVACCILMNAEGLYHRKANP